MSERDCVCAPVEPGNPLRAGQRAPASTGRRCAARDRARRSAAAAGAGGRAVALRDGAGPVAQGVAGGSAARDLRRPAMARSGQAEAVQTSRAAIPQASTRLGAQAMHRLAQRALRPLEPPDAPGSGCRALRAIAPGRQLRGGVTMSAPTPSSSATRVRREAGAPSRGRACRACSSAARAPSLRPTSRRARAARKPWPPGGCPVGRTRTCW